MDLEEGQDLEMGKSAAPWRLETVFLEDDSGRIELVGGPDPRHVVTGTLVSVQGWVHISGKLHVQRWKMIGIQDNVPRALRTRPVFTQQRMCSNEEARYIAFVSGLNLSGDPHSDASRRSSALLEFLRGNAQSPHASVAQCIGHLVICGNLVCETQSEATKAKLRLDSEETKASRAELGKAVKAADAFLAALAEIIPVDVMPGANDPANVFFPQQPIHPALLPQSSPHSTLTLVTNPFEFHIPSESQKPQEPTSHEKSPKKHRKQEPQGDASSSKSSESSLASCITFLGTSGQNIDDIDKYTYGSLTDLDILEMLLCAHHLCPTAPDTLPSYPFVEGYDPYCMTSSTSPAKTKPHAETTKAQPYVPPIERDRSDVLSCLPNVLFAGNRPTFGTRWLGHLPCRILSLSCFGTSGSICLLNVRSSSLEVSELKIGSEETK